MTFPLDGLTITVPAPRENHRETYARVERALRAAADILFDHGEPYSIRLTLARNYGTERGMGVIRGHASDYVSEAVNGYELVGNYVVGQQQPNEIILEATRAAIGADNAVSAEHNDYVDSVGRAAILVTIELSREYAGRIKNGDDVAVAAMRNARGAIEAALAMGGDNRTVIMGIK